MLSFRKLYLISVGLLSVVISFFFFTEVKAQCFGYNRIYATSESNDGSGFFPVDNENNAVGSNLTDFSSIRIPSVYGDRFQKLTFPQTFTGSQPIHVKLGSDVDLSVLGLQVEIQAYSGSSPVGTAITLSSGILLNLLAGENVSDILIPSPSSSYNAVRVKVTGGLISAGKINVYAAYVNDQAGSSINCDQVADVISGTTSGVVGALNGVTNANYAVDASLSTFAELNQNVGVAGYVHLTAIFPSASVTGDSISVVIKDPNALLLDASVFTNLNVVTYLGNTVVETIPANSALIGIRLLDATNHIYRFTYPSGAPFDRISVQSGGLASALSRVFIYDIKRIVPKPKILIDGIATISKTFCVGLNTTLTISPTQTCTTYNWYDAATGGNLLKTGTSYVRNGLAFGTYNYYIEAIRDNCTSTASERTLATIIVNPIPTLTLGANPSICLGTLTAALPFTATTEIPTTYSITWAGGSPLTNVVDGAFPASSPINIAIPPATPAATYAGTITIKNANGCTSSPIGFSVIINPKPTITLGTVPDICIETLTASLPYSATTENPTSYSITWSDPSSTLDDITNAAFPASSPIIIPISPLATTNTHHGTITVKNANGCISDAVPFTLKINPKLPTPNLTITTN